MKIKGVPVKEYRNVDKLMADFWEIELTVEDLAKQLSKHDIDMLHLCKIEDKVIKAIKGEPTEPEKCECANPKKQYSPNVPDWCVNCGKEIPEPPKRIEEVSICLTNNHRDYHNALMHLANKLNELIRAWNER